MPKREKKPVSQAPPDDAEDDLDTITVNKDFAKKYEARKSRELLSNLDPATREQLEAEDESSCDDEEEDDYGELLTKNVDAQISRTLDALRNKDPAIYDAKTVYFEGSRNDVDDENDESGEKCDDSDDGASSGDEPVAGWDTIAKAAEAATPKLTIKDYVRETLLNEGELPDSDEERFVKRRHVEEENEQVARDKTILHDAPDSDEDSNDDDEGDSSSSDEEEDSGDRKVGKEDDSNDKDNGSDLSSDDDEDGKQEKVEVDDVTKKRKSKKSDDDGTGQDDFFTLKKKSKEELEQEERDFKKWTADLVEKKSGNKNGEKQMHSYLDDPAEEKERFLRDFFVNNGWLEPDTQAPNAKDYVVEREISGIGGDGDDDDDAEDEFDDKVDAFEAEYNFRFEDPNAARVTPHARNISESMRRPDERRKKAREARKERKRKEKLVKSEEIKQLKNVKKKEIQSRLITLQDAAGEGVDLSAFDLDADFDPAEFSKQMEAQFGDEYYQTEDAELHARKEGDEQERPDTDAIVGDADETGEPGMKDAIKTLMDEYYNLDYEDIVGGVPVRFKYKQVDKEDFGMTAEEILQEDDKELNRRASLKYLAPYRDRKEVKKRAKTARWKANYGKDAWKRKARGYDGDNGDGTNDNMRELSSASVDENGDDESNKNDVKPHSNDGPAEPKASEEGKKSGRKRKRQEEEVNADAEVANGEKRMKKRKKRRHGKSMKSSEVAPSSKEEVVVSGKERRRKKVIEGMDTKRLAAYNIST